jgi:hypothetical protein
MTTQTLTWSAPTAAATILSTDLNALANAAYSAASAAIDNRTTRHLYMGLQLHLASLTPAAANTGISVYLLPAVDGSVYPDGSGAVAPPAETYLACFTLSTSAGAKERAIAGLTIPPMLFKIVVLNGSGVALAATGNILSYVLYSEQSG